MAEICTRETILKYLTLVDDYIPISTLNDFIFCPYSIYLHNIYMNTDEGLYHATPQTRGKIAHKTVDNKTASTRKNDIISLPVYSSKYRLTGKIDIYKKETRTLIERKYQVKQIFEGQIYQLWAQYLCLKEMGYDVQHLVIYEISSNKKITIDMPDEKGIHKFELLIHKFRTYNPSDKISLNPNKCKRCIYSNLCDKTEEENVY